MKKSTKKIIASLIIPAMLLSFVSCSSTNDSEVTTASPTSLSTEATVSLTESESSAQESDSDTAKPEDTLPASETTLETYESVTEESEETASEKTTEITPAATFTAPSETVGTTLPAPVVTTAAYAVSKTTHAVTTAPEVTTTPEATTTPEVTTTPEATTAPEATTTSDEPPSVPADGMRDITTMELVREMGLGINLGNTLESFGDWIYEFNKYPTVTNFETAWGSPIITEDMIKGYAECGFGVIRIPVAWSNLMEENYTINSGYMARVKQIVNWVLDSGMYAVVNIHHDGGWWTNFPTDKEECMRKYTRVWEQITEAFKDYPDKLMFESLNEEGGWESLWNRWSGSAEGKAESFGLLNEINQKFVDIVRSAGGNNPKRHLLIAGYTTDVELTCDPLYVMPTDKENRCAVSVHYYIPSTFCILEEDADWGAARTEWGNEADIKELNDNMDLLKTTFIDKGVPVIIGEYGTTTKNKTPEMIRLFLSSVAREAYKRHLCPVLWDTHNHFYDRNQCEFIDEELLRQIMAAKN